ncbi:MAG TPA: DsrE family protein [Anaeromyxobacter sp.]|nr:DsrE family protein [Anaeromyxobacter sp.]
MVERRVAVFVSRGDERTVRLAGACALAAATVGAQVDVFLFGDAVSVVVSAREGPPDEPAALLYQARAAGGCRLFACSAGLVEEKVPLEAAERALDAVVGWPTVLAWTKDVTERFSF